MLPAANALVMTTPPELQVEPPASKKGGSSPPENLERIEHELKRCLRQQHASDRIAGFRVRTARLQLHVQLAGRDESEKIERKRSRWERKRISVTPLVFLS